MSEQPKFLVSERVQFHNPSYINQSNKGKIGIITNSFYTYVCGSKSWQYDVIFADGTLDWALYEVELRSVETVH